MDRAPMVSRRSAKKPRWSILSRQVVVVVPTYTAAAHIIEDSELTGLITAGHAAQVAALSGAHVHQIPAELPTLPLSQAWHVRHDLDGAHQWLRAQVAAVLRADRRADGGADDAIES